MGKSDALTTERIFITIPTKWIPKLKALMAYDGSLSIQDEIRKIIAKELVEDESMIRDFVRRRCKP